MRSLCTTCQSSTAPPFLAEGLLNCQWGNNYNQVNQVTFSLPVCLMFFFICFLVFWVLCTHFRHELNGGHLCHDCSSNIGKNIWIKSSCVEAALHYIRFKDTCQVVQVSMRTYHGTAAGCSLSQGNLSFCVMPNCLCDAELKALWDQSVYSRKSHSSFGWTLSVAACFKFKAVMQIYLVI